MTDIEISRNTKLEKIQEIANELGIKEEYIEPYGKYKAKISLKQLKEMQEQKEGKLILVTAINPTPMGEGKTTISIGLADGLRKIGKKSILALREPSLGPVFGMKGGATGGGFSQVAPMEDINLHFTGDIHAITTANNLLSAIIDNHIYYGNELQIEKVTWKRCLDLNDRQLRKINTGLSEEKNIVPRVDGFDISVASEIMAVFCLAKNLKDLKRRLANIIIGYNKQGKPVTAHDLKAEGSMLTLLKDAFNPNLVQTLEHTPAIIHGGPFANIAHGCNSIVATKMSLKLSDYTVTEAGFGSDLGAEKFLNIKTRYLGKVPNAVVIVATIKALKYHGGMPKEELSNEGIEELKEGSKNLLKHIENMKEKFGLNTIVAINKFEQDTENEITTLKAILKEKNIEMSLVEAFAKGSDGAVDLAEKVVHLCEGENKINYIYSLEDSIETKIEKVAKQIYGAESIEFSEEAKEQIMEIEKLQQAGYVKNEIPICIAKTQYSLSDDAKNLQCDSPFTISVKEVILRNGAEFIVILTGKIITMPGLPRVPAAEKIDLDTNNNVIGIF